MNSDTRLPIAIRIGLPLIFMLVVNAAPLPHQFVFNLREARQAQAAGQPGIAAARLGAALALNPWRVDLYEPLAMQALQAGNDEQALQALRAAQQAGRLSLEGQLTLGELYALRGEPEAALEVWNDLAARPGLAGSALAPRLWERVYQAERARRSWEGVVRALRAWRLAEPERARAAYLLGLHLCASAPAEALPLLIEAAQRDAQYNQPVLILRRGLAQAAAAEDPAYAWLMIGRALGRLNEWDVALPVFEKAVAASPGYAEAWALLAEARYQNGLAAQAALEQAQALNPQSALVRAITALHLRRAGRPDLAETYLLEVARQEPDEPAWQIELGNTLVEKGDLVAARAYFLRAQQLAPESPTVLKALVAFSAQYNVDPRGLGLPAARQLVLLTPDDPEALDLMGQLLMRLEDSASAERFLQRALEKEPGFAAAHLHLGQLYLHRGDSSLARLYLRRAAALAPDGPIGSIAKRLLLRYFNEGGRQDGS